MLKVLLEAQECGERVRRRLAVYCVLCTIALMADSAFACVIQWKSPESLEHAAELVVDAEVKQVGPVQSSFRGRNHSYRIAVVGIVRGTVSNRELEVSYEDLLAHRRGELTVCPFKHGSGIEQALVLRDRYRFFLRSASDREILLARPLSLQSNGD